MTWSVRSSPRPSTALPLGCAWQLSASRGQPAAGLPIEASARITLDVVPLNAGRMPVPLPTSDAASKLAACELQGDARVRRSNPAHPAHW